MSLKRTRAADVSEFPVLPSEVFFVCAGIGLVIANLVRFVQAPDFFDWPTVVFFLLGLLGADFVSGVVHWAGDTWGTTKTPIMGWRFVRPFRFHHAYPLDMCKSNFFTTNGDNILAASPMLIVPLFFPLDSLGWLWAAVFVCSSGFFGMWTSQFHLWSHMKHPPRAVRFLQKYRIILSKEHHQRHHKAPYQTNYCITTGWCNPILGPIGFWPALEWVISKTTGATIRPPEPEHTYTKPEDMPKGPAVEVKGDAAADAPSEGAPSVQA